MIIILLAGICLGNVSNSEEFENVRKEVYFEFLSNTNSSIEYNVNGLVNNNEIYCVFPPDTDISKLKAKFNFKGNKVTINGKVQKSNISENSFNNEVIYKLDNGESYKIISVKSDIPLIEINTEEGNEVLSRDEKIKGTMKVSGNDVKGNVNYRGDISIKARGNSSLDFDKKSYRIELNSKSSILGMDAAKDWVLIANHSDKTLMRNKLAYDISQKIGVRYAHSSEFVNLSMNGEFMGSYLFVEPVTVGKGRVEFDRYNNNDVNGQYLLEIDQRLDAKKYFTTNKGIDIIFKYPKVPNDDQIKHIQNFINEFESVLYKENESSETYEDYCNVNTFVDFFILCELFKNTDSDFFSSINLYIDKNKKLSIGPIWDFDRGAGNSKDNGDYKIDGWKIRNEKWYGEFFKCDKFKERVSSRYNELKPVLNEIPVMIDDYYNELFISQKLNFKKWDILNKKISSNYVALGSYEEEVEYFKKWIISRIEWLDINLR